MHFVTKLILEETSMSAPITNADSSIFSACPNYEMRLVNYCRADKYFAGKREISNMDPKLSSLSAVSSIILI